MKELKIEVVSSEKQIRIIENLAGIIWHEHYMSIIGPDQIKYMLDKYQSYSAVSDSLASGYIYYIALEEGTPCGYSAINVGDDIFLSKFYVQKEYRGRGIGRLMLNKITEEAVVNKKSRIWLTCNKFNLDTIAVYKKMGFTIIDSVVTDIGHGFVMDDYVLEKHI